MPVGRFLCALVLLGLCLETTSVSARRYRGTVNGVLADTAGQQDPNAAAATHPAQPVDLSTSAAELPATVFDEPVTEIKIGITFNAPVDTAEEAIGEAAEGVTTLPSETATAPLDAAAAAESVSATATASAAAAVTSFDVIVIGAGMAGLKAAADLRSKGYQVVLLEGRDRIGGRVFSAPLVGSGTKVEVGAQWFHGDSQSNAVYTLATGTGTGQMGVTPLPVKTGTTNALRYTTNSSQVPDADDTKFWNTYNAFVTWRNSRTWTNADSYKTAVDAYIALRASQGTPLDTNTQLGLAHAINTEVEQEFGASTSWLSVRWYDEGLSLLGGNSVMPSGRNLGEIPAFLATGLNAAGAIRLNHNVTRVAYTTTGVTVTGTNAGTPFIYTAKAAIVAIPLGMLKRRGSAFFDPVLSTDKQNAINRLGFGLLNKVVLEFPASYASSGPFSGVDWNAWWVNRLQVPTNDTGYWQEFFVLKKAIGTPILVAFQAGQPALNAENTMNDVATIASVMAQLRTWYGLNMPNPIGTLVTRWWNDPWTFGSYSYQAVGCTGSERGAFKQPEPLPSTNLKGRLWFAGEHVNVQYPSTMQGAYLSGQAAATAVASAYPLATAG